MRTKLIAGALAVVGTGAVAVSLWSGPAPSGSQAQSPSPAPLTLQTAAPAATRPASDVSSPAAPLATRDAAVGWSTADDPQVAAREAVTRMRVELGQQPHFAIAAFTIGFDRLLLVDALRSELGSTVKIHGLSSGTGIMTPDGFHVGKVGAVGVLGVASKDVAFGVVGLDPDTYPTLEDAGEAAVRRAILDAGHQPAEAPDIILMTASNRGGVEQKFLDGIARIVGNRVPVLGGAAMDQEFDHHWVEFTRDGIFREGLVVTAIYTRHKIGWAFESGFRITDKSGVATKSDGNTVYEIDHRPALTVYNEWLNGELMDYIHKSGYFDIAAFTAQHPLCKIVRGASGEVGYVTAHPVPREQNMNDLSLPVGATIEEGTRIQLFSGTWQTMVNRAEIAPSHALINGNIARGHAMFGVLFSCAGAFHCIPASERDRLPLLIHKAVGDVPFLGVISGGEQGYIPGVQNVNANLVQSMVAIGEE